MPTRSSRRDGLRLPCSLLFVLALGLAFHAQAQDPGAQTPFGAVETGVLGQPQLVEADVGEGTELANITLYYRFDGAGDYETLPMRPTQRPGVHAANVPTRDVRARSMEYFVFAEDVTGRRLLKGDENAPLTRELVLPSFDAAGPSSSEEPPIVTSAPAIGGEPEPAGAGNRKYLYYVLGALAVGAIVAAAASSDDGGGGSSGESCGSDGCDVTLVLPVP